MVIFKETIKEMKLKDINYYASNIIDAVERGRQIDLISNSEMPFRIRDAYKIADEIECRKISKDEKVVGFKVGFTNRNIWEEYNAKAPIVGTMYNTTVSPLKKYFPVKNFLEPRIEPEIIFKMKRCPSYEMNDNELLGCIESVAHGFEIVHSVFKDWKFKAADTIAAFGLHGALIHGPFKAVEPCEQTEWVGNLPNFDITLYLNGNKVDKGKGSNILNSGPLEAIRYVLGPELGSAQKVVIKPGDLITTGTLTGAYPIYPNQSWSTELSGIELGGLCINFT